MRSQLTSRSKKQRSLQPDRAHSIGQRRDRREAVFLCAMNESDTPRKLVPGSCRSRPTAMESIRDSCPAAITPPLSCWRRTPAVSRLILPDRSLIVIQGRCEADAALLRDWWIHELADGRENGGDGFIMVGEFLVDLRFKLRKAAGQLLVRGE